MGEATCSAYWPYTLKGATCIVQSGAASQLGVFATQDAAYSLTSGGYYSYTWASPPLNATLALGDQSLLCTGGGSQDPNLPFSPDDPNVAISLSQFSLTLQCDAPQTGPNPGGSSECGVHGPTLNPHFCAADPQNCHYVAYNTNNCLTAQGGYNGEIYAGPVPCQSFSIYQRSCMQVQWPPLSDAATRDARAACCFGTGWAADPVEAAKYCKPTWNPVDPAGECEDIFPAYCREHSVSAAPDGLGGPPWVHGFLGTTDTACGGWYTACLLNGIPTAGVVASVRQPLPSTRWATADGEIAEYCALFDDPVSCGCVNFGLGSNSVCNTSGGGGGGGGGGGNTTAGCTAYASDSSAGGVATQVNVTTKDGFPVGVTDYVCIAQQCQFPLAGDNYTASVPQALIPFDAWVPQFNHTCPSLCLQFMDGQVITAGEVDAGYVYVGDMTGVCSGSGGHSSAGAPSVDMPPTQTSVVFVNQNTRDCGLGLCESQATLSFLNPTANTLNYTVTGDLPHWLEWSDPHEAQGTAVSNVTKQLALLIPDTRLVPSGNTEFRLVVQDTHFPSAKGETIVRVQGIPCQQPTPPSAPLPNPGEGVPVVWTDVLAPWIPFVLLASGIVLLLLYLHSRAQRKAKHQIKKALADVQLLTVKRFGSTVAQRTRAAKDLLTP